MDESGVDHASLMTDSHRLSKVFPVLYAETFDFFFNNENYDQQTRRKKIHTKRNCSLFQSLHNQMEIIA